MIIGCNEFVLPGVGHFNADDDNMPVEQLKAGFDAKFSNGSIKCPYIMPTEKGYETFYPELKKAIVQVQEIAIKKKKKN